MSFPVTSLPRFLFAALFALSSHLSLAAAANAPTYEVGVAKIDITPSYPIRLCGYAVRKTESAGVAQHLYAKAFAIGSDKDKNGPALLITVDNTGVPASIRHELIQRLQKRNRRLKADQVALCS